MCVCVCVCVPVFVYAPYASRCIKMDAHIPGPSKPKTHRNGGFRGWYRQYEVFQDTRRNPKAKSIQRRRKSVFPPRKLVVVPRLINHTDELFLPPPPDNEPSPDGGGGGLAAAGPRFSDALRFSSSLWGDCRSSLDRRAQVILSVDDRAVESRALLHQPSFQMPPIAS